MARRIAMPDKTPPPQQYVWGNIAKDMRMEEGGKKILDVGPGKTLFAGMMASWGNEVTVVDRLPQILQFQARIIHGNKIYWSLQLSDGEELPFKDRSFEIITACWSVANIENSEESDMISYRELFRVASKMIFTVVNFSAQGGVRQSQYSGRERVYNLETLEERILKLGRLDGWLVDRVSFFRDDGAQVNHHFTKESRRQYHKDRHGPADHALIVFRRD